MPTDFRVRAVPFEAWDLELIGSENVKFNGEMLQACLGEMVQCAMRSGCLSPNEVRLTDTCAETLIRHHEASDCVTQGFGLRVKPVGGVVKKYTRSFGDT